MMAPPPAPVVFTLRLKVCRSKFAVTVVAGGVVYHAPAIATGPARVRESSGERAGGAEDTH